MKLQYYDSFKFRPSRYVLNSITDIHFINRIIIVSKMTKLYTYLGDIIQRKDLVKYLSKLKG